MVVLEVFEKPRTRVQWCTQSSDQLQLRELCSEPTPEYTVKFTCRALAVSFESTQSTWRLALGQRDCGSVVAFCAFITLLLNSLNFEPDHRNSHPLVQKR
jgi:hypothetical protein